MYIHTPIGHIYYIGYVLFLWRTLMHIPISQIRKLRHGDAISLYRVLLRKLGFAPRHCDSQALLPIPQVLLTSDCLASANSNMVLSRFSAEE